MSYLSRLGGLFGKSDLLLGIELGEMAVKMVAIERHRQHEHLAFYDVMTLPDEIIKDGQITDPSAVGMAINHLLLRCRTSCRQAAVAMSGALAMTRVIELPADLDDDEVMMLIRLDAHQYISEPLDEVSFDFVVLSRTLARTQVLLVVMRESVVDACVESLAYAQVQAQVVDTHEYALARGFGLMADRYAKKCVAVVQVDRHHTGFFVANLSQGFEGFEYHRQYPCGYQLFESYAMPSDVAVLDEVSDESSQDGELDFIQWQSSMLHKTTPSDDTAQQGDVPQLKTSSCELSLNKTPSTPSMPSAQALPSSQPSEKSLERSLGVQADEYHLTFEVDFDGKRWQDDMLDDANSANVDTQDAIGVGGWGLGGLGHDGTQAADAQAQCPAQQQFVTQMAQWVSKMISHHRLSGGLAIEQVVLVGDRQRLTGLDGQISAQTGVSADFANPFEQMSVAGHTNLDDLHTKASDLVVACGLALRAFD